MPHFMIVSILCINLLNLSLIKKNLFLRNMEPLSPAYLNMINTKLTLISKQKICMKCQILLSGKN